MSAQSVDLYNTFLAALALISLVGAVGLVFYRVIKGKEAALSLLGDSALWLA